MKIQIVSDLHTEFFRHNTKAIEMWLDKIQSNADVLILAGDTGAPLDQANPFKLNNYKFTLDKLCAHYPDVILIPGNHDYYHGSFEEFENFADEMRELYNNLSILDNSIVSIKGTKFIGLNLWFPDRSMNMVYIGGMNDFHLIKDCPKTCYIKSDQAISLLSHELNSDSIVVSHHLPSHKSIEKDFKSSNLNLFYVNEDVEDYVILRKPRYWLHGHTHCSNDYLLGDTRVISNPFGYYNYKQNKEFNPQLVIEI
jgi:predicted MPP superfamily phosphohydrolase